MKFPGKIPLYLLFLRLRKSAQKRQIAVAWIAILCVSTLSWSAPATADGLSAEKAVFDEIAAELAGQLHAKATLFGSDNGPAKIAIAPFRDDKLPLVPAQGREFNDLLTAGLLALKDRRFQVMSRDSLEALILDMTATGSAGRSDNDIISALLESAQVKFLIIGRIERIGESELTISYEITNSDGGTVAQAAPRRLPWRPEYGRDFNARLLNVAVNDAAQALAAGASDLQLLRLGGIRYEASGQTTDFSYYLEDSLSVAFKADYASALTGRKIRVERVELSAAALNAMRGKEAPESNLNDENLGAEAGAYTLTGTYWLQGAIIDLRLSLTAPGGGSVGWQGAVFESDIGNIALRPSGDFGVWRRRDGIGPINFTLTTDNGHDPVYRVRDKLNLIVQSDRDIWLHCYYLQQDGKVFQIFPNPFQREANIAGGRPHTIPGQRFPFDFDILPPAGQELVKCFALGADVADRLPPEFAQDEFVALPTAMKHQLPSLFRALTGVAMTEQSTVINVVE